MKDAVVVTDNKAIVEMINPGFTRLFGYTEKEALGRPLNELITQDHSSADLRRSRHCSFDDIKNRCKKMKCIKNGRTIGVLSRITPIMMDNETIGSFAFYREVY